MILRRNGTWIIRSISHFSFYFHFYFHMTFFRRIIFSDLFAFCISPTCLHIATILHMIRNFTTESSIFFFFLISVNIKFFRKIFFNLFVFYISSIYLHATMILHSIRDFTWKRYLDRSSEFSFYSSVTLLLPYNVLPKDHFLFFDHLAFRISPIYLHITTIRVFTSKPYVPSSSVRLSYFFFIFTFYSGVTFFRKIIFSNL